MARNRDPVEAQLTVLRDLADSGDYAQLTAAVRKGLKSLSNLVAERCAKLITEWELSIPTEDLLSVYKRFLLDPTENDKSCRAKLPLVEALVHLQYDEPEFFLDGMKYVQMEPVWNGQEDSAGNLRGACAHGLIRCRLASPAATMLALVDLLNDSDRLARMHAACCIGLMNSTASVPLLRFKVLTGDSDFEVIGQCFRSILECDASGSIGFVASYLTGDTDLAIEAAAALGETRNESAVQAIISCCDGCPADLVEAFFVSIALSRLPAAVDFLLSKIEHQPHHAGLAVRALAPIKFYTDLADRVVAAVKKAGDARLTAEFQKHFNRSKVD